MVARLMLIAIYMKFHEESLKGFLSYRAVTSVTDRQSPGGKAICLLTVKGGDIIIDKI